MEPIPIDIPVRHLQKASFGFKNDGMKVPLAHFEHVNELNEFQREVIPLVISPGHTLEDILKAIKLADGMVNKLAGSSWKPLNKDGDMVHQPQHYAIFKVEPTFFNQENSIDWCRGNALKYICRYPYKNGVEDLRKAMRYLAMYVRWVEGDPKWSR